MCVPSLKVFVLECLTWWIDALSTCPIAFGYISTLNDKAVDDTMDATAQEVHLARLVCISFLLISATPGDWLQGQLLLSCLLCILSCAQPAEVFGSYRCYVIVELKDDLSDIFGANGELEEHFWVFRHFYLAFNNYLWL